MGTKHFKHDCDRCYFVDHLNDLDIYLCRNPGYMGTSLIARHGNDPSSYASTPLRLFQSTIGDNQNIGGTNPDGSEWTMTFREYLASDKATRYHKAWLVALAILQESNWKF